jgi:hypothetical protein
LHVDIGLSCFGPFHVNATKLPSGESEGYEDGDVVDNLVQPRRNKQAAKKFFRKLLKAFQYVPRVIITDKAVQLCGRKGRGHAFG